MEYLWLHINFVYFENVFDSLDINALWNILLHYGTLEIFVRIIKSSYGAMTCKKVHAWKLPDDFVLKTIAKQGCLISLFLFLLAIDWSNEGDNRYTTNYQPMEHTETT